VAKPTRQLTKIAKPTLRTAPQQIRGQKRVDLILDVSEKLLLDKGYEALTTNAVAAEAGISIGSLYHFFGDKVAILEALIARYNEAYFEVLVKAHQDKDLKLESYLDTLLKTLIQVGEGRPGLIIAFRHAITASAKFEKIDQDFTTRATTLIGAYYRQKNPKLTAKKATLVAWIVLTMAEAFLLSLGNEDAETRYQEVKKVIQGYLEQYLS
jgi:AcrR family transcriptional regulator